MSYDPPDYVRNYARNNACPSRWPWTPAAKPPGLRRRAPDAHHLPHRQARPGGAEIPQRARLRQAPRPHRPTAGRTGVKPRSLIVAALAAGRRPLPCCCGPGPRGGCGGSQTAAAGPGRWWPPGASPRRRASPSAAASPPRCWRSRCARRPGAQPPAVLARLRADDAAALVAQARRGAGRSRGAPRSRIERLASRWPPSSWPRPRPTSRWPAPRPSGPPAGGPGFLRPIQGPTTRPATGQRRRRGQRRPRPAGRPAARRHRARSRPGAPRAGPRPARQRPRPRRTADPHRPSPAPCSPAGRARRRGQRRARCCSSWPTPARRASTPSTRRTCAPQARPDGRGGRRVARPALRRRAVLPRPGGRPAARHRRNPLPGAPTAGLPAPRHDDLGGDRHRQEGFTCVLPHRGGARA